MAYSTGMDRSTGRILTDFAHTAQSVGDIFSTDFGERVLRRFYGSDIPRLLGENMVPETFLRFFSAFGTAMLQEPRLLLLRVQPLSVSRDGKAGFRLVFEYRPRGHLGDFTPAGKRFIDVAKTGDRMAVTGTGTV